MNSVLDEIYGGDSVPSEQQTTRLRDLCADLSYQRLKKQKLEEELKQVNERIWSLEMTEIPDLSSELGVDRIGLPELGIDILVKPYYKANIASDWEEDRRAAAFDYLERIGVGDIIKTDVRFVLGRDSLQMLEDIVRVVSSVQGTPAPVVAKNVPWNTLTSVVRELTEKGTPLELETIGAVVGQRAQIKERKE